MFKGLKLGVLALLLVACGAPRPRQAGPQSPDESRTAPNLSLSGKVYRVDESHSELRILVYRAGPLARFGHNHVVVNRSIRGTVNLPDGAGAAIFRLNVPVSGFVVDDAQARREEGPDFAAEVPDEAKAGTLRNMLSTSLLDGDEFPAITVSGMAAGGEQGPWGGDTPGAAALIAGAAISVAGHESTIEVPLNLRIDSSHLSATGSLELRQSALGLTPYSLMLGALQVQDAITIKFEIVASAG